MPLDAAAQSGRPADRYVRALMGLGAEKAIQLVALSSIRRNRHEIKPQAGCNCCWLRIILAPDIVDLSDLPAKPSPIYTTIMRFSAVPCSAT